MTSAVLQLSIYLCVSGRYLTARCVCRSSSESCNFLKGNAGQAMHVTRAATDTPASQGALFSRVAVLSAYRI
ncbi:hypothetical protein CERSUDRAFT_87138 [Gelatoporia subvermispora B]|uniref:Secreted protein n=1 Tax=Ceriporiopsis subvermispora (strain B) TaxID=914234 RepID=M2R4G7_CERS8|nr:hypothetical protein CERSUDRAFT_87138 [Gelatoporia subvermispora B]